MDTKQLSPKIEKILNRQVTNEAGAAQIYLSFGAWADDLGYSGISNYLFRHSTEERDHMMKIMEYIMQRGGKVKIEALEKPKKDPDSLHDCFVKLFQHEIDNTKAIYDIVNLAMEEKDWATWNFAQWFVKEQIEEETMVMDLLDQLKVAGGENASTESLYELDRDLGNEDDEADLARDATMEDQ